MVFSPFFEEKTLNYQENNNIMGEKRK